MLQTYSKKSGGLYYTACEQVVSTYMRTLLLGMEGPFSCIVLERLLAAGVSVVAVLLNGQRFRELQPAVQVGGESGVSPAESLELPLTNARVNVALPGMDDSSAGGQNTAAELRRAAVQVPASTLGLAMQAGIPTFECNDIGDPEVVKWLTGQSLDIACVACWNRIIPPRVLGIPRQGFLNVHPSLLPAYRGPFPLFWQFRAGEVSTGVTVHWMDAGLDTGDIAGQRAVQFAEGMGGPEAESLCASAGGDLLAEVIVAAAQGQAVRRPQPKGGSYMPAPSAEYFALDANWHARRAFNFMRGTAEWGVPYLLETEDRVLWLDEALEWREEAPVEGPVNGRVWAPFRGDALLATLCDNAVA